MKRYHFLCCVFLLGIILCSCQTQTVESSNKNQQLEQKEKDEKDLKLSLQSSIGNPPLERSNALYAEILQGDFLTTIINSILLGLFIGRIGQLPTPGFGNMMMLEMKRLILGI